MKMSYKNGLYVGQNFLELFQVVLVVERQYYGVYVYFSEFYRSCCYGQGISFVYVNIFNVDKKFIWENVFEVGSGIWVFFFFFL